MNEGSDGLGSGGFNPVLGFLVVSTGRRRARRARDNEFQSRLGFSGRLDLFGRFEFVRQFLFQSRLGFSGRLDILGGRRRMSAKRVSIPSWVFWSSRHNDGETTTRYQTMFQSRLGFSGRLDWTGLYPSCRILNVSIPSWVFWSSRPDELPPRQDEFMFQSRLGFSGRLDLSSWQPPHQDSCMVSIPSWVFWSSRPYLYPLGKPFSE